MKQLIFTICLLLLPGIVPAQQDALLVLEHIRFRMDKLQDQHISYRIVQTSVTAPSGSMVSDSGRFYIGRKQLYRKSVSGEIIIGDGYQVMINHRQKVVHVSQSGSLSPEEIDPMASFRNIFTNVSELRIKSLDANTGEIFIKSRVFDSGEYSLVYNKSSFLIEKINVFPAVAETTQLLPRMSSREPELVISFRYLSMAGGSTLPKPADVFSKEKNKLVLKSKYHGYQLYATAK